MIYLENECSWPLLIGPVTEKEVELFKSEINETEWLGIYSVCDYEVSGQKLAVIDCSTTSGKEYTMEWWTDHGHEIVNPEEPIIMVPKVVFDSVLNRLCIGILNNKIWAYGKQVIEGIPVEYGARGVLSPPLYGTRWIIMKANGLEVNLMQKDKNTVVLHNGHSAGEFTRTPFGCHLKWVR